MSHIIREMTDFLPTGKPVVGKRRSYGELPAEERLGVGVLGLHEGHTMLVALRASGLCRAVAACDLEYDKRAAAHEAAPGIFVTDRYEDMLAREDVQIVCIYTPDSMHAEHIAMAFEAGKHMLCTKPLLNDPDQAPRLLELSKKLGVRLQVGQSTRYFEPFQRQRELYEQGEFGTVEVLDCHYVHRMDWFYEKSPWSVAETHWAYLGLSHPVDLVRWYLGPIAEVHAYGMKTELGQRFGVAHEDAMVVNLRARDGRIARVLGHYGMHELPTGRSLIECLLMGSEGTSLARYPQLRLTWVGRDGIEREEDYEHSMAGYYYRHELKGMHYGEFCNCIDEFASRILSGEPNSPDLSEGVETLYTMTAIVDSLRTGAPAKVKT
jgi:predicted dehydrogenase